jgi:hypothetical protein
VSLKRIAVCYNVPEALVLTATLEAYGIPVTHTGLRHAWVNWPVMVALGGIGVFVPSFEAEVAGELLGRPGTEAPDLWESRAFRAHPVRNSLIALSIFVWPVPIFPYWLREWRD